MSENFDTAKLHKKVTILVTGWCPPTVLSPADEKQAWDFIDGCYEMIKREYRAEEYVVVSGLKDVGVMVPAYRLADKRGWRLVGVASKLVKWFRHYPVMEKHIIGNAWGDESKFFTDMAINSDGPFVMINVAGGNQAARETQAIRDAGGIVFEQKLTRNRMRFDWENIKAYFAFAICFLSLKTLHLQSVKQADGITCIHCGYFKHWSEVLADLHAGGF